MHIGKPLTDDCNCDAVRTIAIIRDGLLYPGTSANNGKYGGQKMRGINKMRSSIWVSWIFLMLSVFPCKLYAGHFQAQGIPIFSLPFTISCSGKYFIARDTTSRKNGIIVNADHVIIDLNGYSIIGRGAGSNNGVYMEGRSNVEIKNGTIRNFGENGICEASGDGSQQRIINIRAIENGASGITLRGSSHSIKDCTVANNVTLGLFCAASIVSGNIAYRNGETGISAWLGSVVTGNTAFDNGSGIYANGSTVIGNNAFHNASYGISLGGHSLVDQNTAYDNATSNIVPCPTCVFGRNLAPLSPP